MLIKKSSLNPDGINSIKTVKSLFNLDAEDSPDISKDVSKKHTAESESGLGSETLYNETKIKLIK